MWMVIDLDAPMDEDYQWLFSTKKECKEQICWWGILDKLDGKQPHKYVIAKEKEV